MLLNIRRELLKNNSLANLYDPLLMPQQLIEVHQELDKIVYKVYGKKLKNKNELEVTKYLFELYEEITVR
jgi:hypothetical protein